MKGWALSELGLDGRWAKGSRVSRVVWQGCDGGPHAPGFAWRSARKCRMVEMDNTDRPKGGSEVAGEEPATLGVQTHLEQWRREAKPPRILEMLLKDHVDGG